MALVKAGKIKEAQAIIEAEKVKVKYSPDTVRVTKGKARFTKKGRLWNVVMMEYGVSNNPELL
ncbi:MAG: hypothetical protein WDM87_04455 [Terracidiphilus sp.]